MACFSPLSAWQTDGGEIIFSERGKIRRALTLPCGQCVGCRLERSRQWAVRCVHESKMHEHSVFVTLTYDDDHVPYDSSLIYRHYQLFMKRLRKHFATRVRFYMCGEYGDLFSRPHFHACLFGCFFSDRQLYRELPSGSKLWTSKSLEKLWPYGFSSIGDVTFDSAAYVARYVMKKVTGPRAEAHYEAVDPVSGEIFQREPEFTRMSLKPGIGATFFEKYKKEIFPRDEVIVRGMKMKPPKYYDRLLALDADSYFAQLDGVVAFEREHRAAMLRFDNTPDRLRTRELVTHARLKFKKRSIS